MSVLWAGNMSGPRFQRHVFGQLLLLLLLLSGLTRTVFCQEDEEVTPENETQVENTGEDENSAEEGATESPDSETTPIPTENTEVNEEGRGSGRFFEIGAAPDSTIDTTVATEGTPSPEEEVSDLLPYVIPAVLVVLLIAIILCCIFIHRRLNSNTQRSEVSKEDPFLECSSTEKVPMPMFEEDVPSVLELEMEDLDGWIKKDGELSEHNQKA